VAISTSSVGSNDLSPGRLPNIPDPPKRGAVRALQRALVSRTSTDDGSERGLTDDAAEAIALAVADPAETRRYALRHLSYVQVPGGTLTVMRDKLLVNRVITYPVNPRVLDDERFPVAAADTEGSHLFWPERDLVGDPEGHCGLLLRGQTRRRVSAVLQSHGRRLRIQNRRLDTIPKIGVLRPIMAMPMIVRADDEPDVEPRTVLTSVEGSSRTAWSHHAQGIDAVAPLYGATADPAAAQAVARHLAGVRSLDASSVTERDLEQARTLLIPAEIIIGFTPDRDDQQPNLTAIIDQLLGLTHIDPPAPWTEQATESKIGDKVLAELRANGHVSADEEAWLAGMLSRAEAQARGLDPWLARRSARLLWLLSRDSSGPIGRAVSEGVRRASVQRRVRRETKSNVGAALALRAVDSGRSSRPVRAALPRAMRMQLFYEDVPDGGTWAATTRSPDELLDLALLELRDGVAGAAALELCALATWPLVTSVNLARGSAKSRAEGDPRDPETILSGLLRTELGIRVLHRAAVDDLGGIKPREIDTNSYAPVPTADGTWRPMTERWLRWRVLRPEGASDEATRRAEADERETLTAQRRLDLALERLDGHVQRLVTILHELTEIEDDDHLRLIDREGIGDDLANRLTQALVDAMTVIRQHNMTFNNRYGSPDENDEETEIDDDVDSP
jgi:hypothetical protein